MEVVVAGTAMVCRGTALSAVATALTWRCPTASLLGAQHIDKRLTSGLSVGVRQA